MTIRTPVPTPSITVETEADTQPTTGNGRASFAPFEDLPTATAIHTDPPTAPTTTNVIHVLNAEPIDEEAEIAVQPEYTAASTTNTSDSLNRPEFVSVTFYSQSSNSTERLGFQLYKDYNAGGDIRIKRSSQSDCPRLPFQNGDRVLSINQKSCHGLSESAARALIDNNHNQSVTIICHNQGGKANLVETMLEKRTADETVGISFKSRQNGSGVEISTINPRRPLVSSLLNVGDRILAINGVDCNEIGPQVAVDIIRGSNKYVTFLSETLHSTAVVVSSSPGEAPITTLPATTATVVLHQPQQHAPQQTLIRPEINRACRRHRRRRRLIRTIAITLTVIIILVIIF